MDDGEEANSWVESGSISTATIRDNESYDCSGESPAEILVMGYDTSSLRPF